MKQRRGQPSKQRRGQPSKQRRGQPSTFDTRDKARQPSRHFLLSSRPIKNKDLAALLAYYYGITTARSREGGIMSDTVLNDHLKRHGGDSILALRLDRGPLQSALDDVALRIVKDNIDTDYMHTMLASVDEDQQGSHQPFYHVPEPDKSRSQSPIFQRVSITRTSKSNEIRERSLKKFSIERCGCNRSRRLRIRPQTRDIFARLTPPVPGSQHTDPTWETEIETEALDWKEFLGEAVDDVDAHLDEIRTKVLDMYEDKTLIDPAIRLGDLDWRGQTLLHAFIRYIDPRTMQADKVQETLRVILGCGEYGHDSHGMTPLHLSCKLALPHVVATILLHLIRIGNSPSDSIDEGEIAEIMFKAIAVADFNKISLLTDLHLTYWVARYSDELHAFHFEIDALICVRLVTNALAGLLPDEKHKFRSLREDVEFIKRQETTLENSKKRRKRRRDNPSSSERYSSNTTYTRIESKLSTQSPNRYDLPREALKYPNIAIQSSSREQGYYSNMEIQQSDLTLNYRQERRMDTSNYQLGSSPYHYDYQSHHRHQSYRFDLEAANVQTPNSTTDPSFIGEGSYNPQDYSYNPQDYSYNPQDYSYNPQDYSYNPQDYSYNTPQRDSFPQNEVPITADEGPQIPDISQVPSTQSCHPVPQVYGLSASNTMMNTSSTDDSYVSYGSLEGVHLQIHGRNTPPGVVDDHGDQLGLSDNIDPDSWIIDF